MEFSKQRLEKTPGIEFKRLNQVASAGTIHPYDDSYEKARISRPMVLKTFSAEVGINSLQAV